MVRKTSAQWTVCLVWAVWMLAATSVSASAAPRIEGDRAGRVTVHSGETGLVLHEFLPGPGVVRETFLLKDGAVAVASQADRATFWNLRTGEAIGSLGERIYAFAPDESLFVTYVPGPEGGLALRETASLALESRLFGSVRGGPKSILFSPGGLYMAVEFCSDYPLRDEDYPLPSGLLRGRHHVELFDLARGVRLAEFSQHPSGILGAFDSTGTYYFLRNPKVLLDGIPYDEGWRFELKRGIWESVGPGIPPPQPSGKAEGSYDVRALVDGVTRKIATLTINKYATFEDSLTVGVVIEATVRLEADAPTCCLEFWQFVAADSWPAQGGGSCGHLITAPYLDPPNGGYAYSPFDAHPRYNEQFEQQFVLSDRPSIPKTGTAGQIRFESSVGVEKTVGSGGVYSIPDSAGAFQWGFRWDGSSGEVEKLDLVLAADPSLNRAAALAQSCFSGWTVSTAMPVNPCIQIYVPTTASPVNVGPTESPQTFTAEVLVGPPFIGQIVKGLDSSAFDVSIGGKSSRVVSLVELEDRYILTLRPPDKAAGIPENGLYDLKMEVNYASRGRSTALAAKSVLYSSRRSPDIVLVIDRTGSMGSSGYMEPAKNAARQFISYMNPEDMVGVVSFNTGATVNYPLTLIDSDASKIAAQNSINGIYSSDYTSIGSGMRAGQQQLNTRGRTDDAHAMVLLSDGGQNTPPAPDDVLPEIPEKTDIYTIALGREDTNEASLQSIAQQTGGRYFMAPDAQQLQEIYNLILGAVTGAQTLVSASGPITQGETVSAPALVDGSVRESTFSVGWRSGNLGLALKRPDGGIVDSLTAEADSMIKFVKGSTYAYYVVDLPEPGSWDLVIRGRSVSGSQTYMATVTAESDLKIRARAHRTDYVTGQPLTVLVSLENAADPVREAAVVAVITKPGTSMNAWVEVNGDLSPPPGSPVSASPDTLLLYDDGLHNDGGPADGVYGNQYADVDRSGSYAVRIQATGRTRSGGGFQRVALLNIYVSAPPPAWVGRVRGVCTYPGRIAGDVLVGCWSANADMTGPADFQVKADSLGPDSCRYELARLQDGIYFLSAFLDRNGNGSRDETEPYGRHPLAVYVVGGGLADSVNIALSDPTASQVEIYPNPYREGQGSETITFGHLDRLSTVKVYTLSGDLVRESDALHQTAATGLYQWEWDTRNSAGEMVARGVYQCLIRPGRGESTVEKVAIIR